MENSWQEVASYGSNKMAIGREVNVETSVCNRKDTVDWSGYALFLLSFPYL